MVRHLVPVYSNPLEREFEAWIVDGIEAYCHRIGLAYAVFAMDPRTEASWPADEALFLDAKLFGLQFKQAKASAPNPDRLSWTFHQPADQFRLVKANAEIFYCLPTFINRQFRQCALDHCLFWRPDKSSNDMNAWYDNPSARTTQNTLKGEMRWGLFIESVLSCKIGARVSSVSEANDLLGKIQRSFAETLRTPIRERDASTEAGTTVYMFAVKREG